MTVPLARDDRYVVISADGHAGADLLDYRPYLESRYLDDFDVWAPTYVNPFADLRGDTAYRNWDSDRRLSELESDGVVGEVLFPNTVPPFFPRGNLVARPPAAGELELRWAGLRAHNRWMADFCAEAPGRRAGMAQIFLNDVDAAVAEIRWARDAGLFGGVLLPGVAPDAGLPPLYAPDYEPIWAVCEELDLPLNNHSGQSAPDYGEYAASMAVWMVELRLVLAPRLLAPRVRRRLRPPPGAEARAHGAVGGLGARGPPDARPPVPSASRRPARPRRTSAATSSARWGWRRRKRGRGSASPAPASSDPASASCATRSASTRSCGARTTRTSKAPTRTRPKHCGTRSRASTPARSRPWSAATRRGSTASICRPWLRSRRGSAGARRGRAAARGGPGRQRFDRVRGRRCEALVTRYAEPRHQEETR